MRADFSLGSRFDAAREITPLTNEASSQRRLLVVFRPRTGLSANRDEGAAWSPTSQAAAQRSLLRTHRVGGALDEGLDLHDILVLQLAGEVGHAATLEGPVEDDVLQVREIARLSSSAPAAPSKRQAEA